MIISTFVCCVRNLQKKRSFCLFGVGRGVFTPWWLERCVNSLIQMLACSFKSLGKIGCDMKLCKNASYEALISFDNI